MSIFSSLVNNQDESSVKSVYYPEPAFTITIEPTLKNGDVTKNGKQVVISGFQQPISFVTIDISASQQLTTLTFIDNSTQTLDGIYVIDFSCENYLFEKQGNATITLTMKNLLFNNATIQYDLASPFLDLFQAGFIVTIKQYNPNSLNDNQQLFTGFIATYDIAYNINNLILNLQVESYLSVLNRSACVQTALDQSGQQIYITTIVSQLYNFNALLQKILNETIIAQSLASIQYYKAPNEIEAVGENGSAIGINSKIYVDTPATDSKLNIILRSLYPYQRIFYVDNAGNFIITPLQAYFDESQDWRITMAEEEGLIPASDFRIVKNTATVQNRATTNLLQIYTQFNQTTNTQSKTGGVAVATPSGSGYFTRLNEFITSQEYLQTYTAVQEINTNVVNNAGLLNIAKNFKNIQGLVNKTISIDNNLDYITTTHKDTDKVKYYIKLYAAKALAEQLFNETQLTITIPTNLTFNINTNTFRIIPLNQLVQVPYLYNKVLDNIQEYFCFGYKLSYNLSNGAMTTLYLMKPYTYTALWCDGKLDLLAINGFS